jgi:hypothetical protein
LFKHQSKGNRNKKLQFSVIPAQAGIRYRSDELHNDSKAPDGKRLPDQLVDVVISAA